MIAKTTLAVLRARNAKVFRCTLPGFVSGDRGTAIAPVVDFFCTEVQAIKHAALLDFLANEQAPPAVIEACSVFEVPLPSHWPGLARSCPHFSALHRCYVCGASSDDDCRGNDGQLSECPR